MPGVQVALPVFEQQANVIGPSGQRSVDLIGTDPRFAHFGGPLLRRFSAAAARRPAGDRAARADRERNRRWALLETSSCRSGRASPRRCSARLSRKATSAGWLTARSRSRRSPTRSSSQAWSGRITRIFVRGAARRATREVQRARAARRGAEREPRAGHFDSKLFAVASAPESKSETLFSAISALVGFMFALNAMLVTVPCAPQADRRRPSSGRHASDDGPDPAVRRRRPRGASVRRSGSRSATCSRSPSFHATPGYLSFAFPVGNERIVTWQSVALAVGAGMAAPSRECSGRCVTSLRAPAGGAGSR